MSEENKAANDVVKGLKIMGYDDNVSNAFHTFINDEDFDNETLRSDVLEATDDDLENCSVVEHLSKQFPNLFGTVDKQKDLLSLLQNAINNEWDKLTTYPYTIWDPNDPNIVWTVTKDQNKEATQFMKVATPNLIEDREKADKALMDVIAIGTKNNFPLLNYLTDTYSRYRINNQYLNKKDLTTGDWNKEYKFFGSFKNKRVLEKLNSSITSFYKRLFPPVSLGNSLSLIDDDINEFSEYFVAMNEAIKTLVQKGVNIPFQIDMMIIPKNVESSIGDDEKGDEEEDEEDDDIGVDCIGNIEHRLDSNKFKYEKYENEHKEKMKRIFVQRFEALINDKRQQRIIVYVDRRNPKYIVPKKQCDDYIKNGYGQNKKDLDDKEETLCNKYKNGRKNDKKKTWKDTIYFVQSPDKLYAEIPKRHTPETSFWASTQCMLPSIKSIEKRKNNQAFGCRYNFNGFGFIISWHIEAADLIRCYWFTNCWGTRMIPNDITILWPKHFKQNKLSKDQTSKLKDMQQINDKGFKNWYEKTTGNKLLIF